MSGSLRPYSYRLRGSVYEFATDGGDEYIAYFIDRSSASPHFRNVYEFNFERRRDGSSPRDERIADTICSILNTVFESNRNAIITNCETLDHREHGRYKLFQMWYAKFRHPLIDKIDKEHHTEDYDLYSSLFIRKDNPDYDRIVRDFMLLNEHGYIPAEDFATA